MCRLLLLVCVFAILAAPARAHECALFTGTCAFSEVVAYGGAAPGRLHEPGRVIAAADGRVAVGSVGTDRTVVYDGSGRTLHTVDGGAVAFAAGGSLWTAAPGRLRRFDPSGARMQEITEGLAPEGAAYRTVRGAATGDDGRLRVIADDVLLVYGAGGRLERTIRRGTPDGFASHALVGSAPGGAIIIGRQEGPFERLGPDGSVTATLSDLPAGAWPPGSTVASDGRLFVAGTSETWIYDPGFARIGSVARGTPEWGGGLAVSAGTLLFTDSEGDRLRRFDMEGRPLGSWGTERAAGLNRPSAVVVMPDQRVVVADTRDRRIVRFNPDRTLDRVLRDFGLDGERPLALAVGRGGEIFATYESGLVERVGPAGEVRATWRVGGEPQLRGAAVAPDGSLWLRDRTDLAHFTADGVLLERRAAGLPFTYASGNGLAIDGAGNLYAALPDAIRKLSPSGAVLAEFPSSLAEGVDVMPHGAIIVTTQSGVSLIGPDGRPQAWWGDHGTPAGDLRLAFDAAYDDAGRIYVADNRGQRVLRFTFAGAAAGGGAPPAVPAPVVELGAAKTLRVARSGAIRVRVSCSAACRGTLRLTDRAGRSRTIGAATFRRASRGGASVRLRIRSWARTRIRSRGVLPAVARATAGDATARRTVVLRAR